MDTNHHKYLHVWCNMLHLLYCRLPMNAKYILKWGTLTLV